MSGKRNSIIVLIFAVCFGMLIIMNSCSVNETVNSKASNEGDKKMTLNERQISICEDLGLATNYDELSLQQQKCISRIEELLQYLDNKYNTTFNYRGYYEAFAPVYQKEKLEAYTDDTGEFEYTTLTVDDDGSFVDDYPFQLVKPIVRYDFINYMQNKFGKEFKIYVIRGKTEIEDASSIK